MKEERGLHGLGGIIKINLSSTLLLFQPREKGRMRFHRLQNVQIALDFLKQRQVRQYHVLPVLPGNFGLNLYLGMFSVALVSLNKHLLNYPVLTLLAGQKLYYG